MCSDDNVTALLVTSSTRHRGLPSVSAVPHYDLRDNCGAMSCLRHPEGERNCSEGKEEEDICMDALPVCPPPPLKKKNKV